MNHHGYDEFGNHFRSYLSDEDEVLNVLQYHQQALVNLIHSQMQEHFVESATSYEPVVTKGFRTLRSNNFTMDADQSFRDFRQPIPDGEKHLIRSMLFGGFRKCLYPYQKFDTDPERRFAVIIDNDEEVLKWFKPAKNDFQIHHSHDDSYEPDFVIETKTAKYICEPKRASDLDDEIVLAKAEAAATWCAHANDNLSEGDGKRWEYLLIPHDQILAQMTLNGFAATFKFSPS